MAILPRLRRRTRKENPVVRRRAEREALSGRIRRAEPLPPEPLMEDTPTNPRKGPLTGRMLVMVVLFVFTGFIMAPQFKVFMTQRQEVQGLQADIAAQKAKQEELKSELARYSDDAYTKQQARERLFMVMPGETRFMTTGQLPQGDEAVKGSAASSRDRSWSGSYLDAIRRAAQ